MVSDSGSMGAFASMGVFQTESTSKRGREMGGGGRGCSRVVSEMGVDGASKSEQALSRSRRLRGRVCLGFMVEISIYDTRVSRGARRWILVG